MTTAVLQRGRRLVSTVAIAGALGATCATAAQADVAPVLKAPGAGKTLAVGSQPTFKVVDNGNAYRHTVWLTIAVSRKRDRYGALKPGNGGTFTDMKHVRRHLYTHQPPNYTFPDWFMQKPGTYYWQAYHINCSIRNAQRTNCHVYSPIRSFVVQ